MSDSGAEDFNINVNDSDIPESDVEDESGQRLLDAYIGDNSGLQRHLHLFEAKDVPEVVMRDPVAMEFIRDLQKRLNECESLLVETRLALASAKAKGSRRAADGTEKGKGKRRSGRTDKFSAEQRRISDLISDVARRFAFVQTWPVAPLRSTRPILTFDPTTPARYAPKTANDDNARLEEIYAVFDDTLEVQRLIGTKFFMQEWCYYINDQRSKLVSELKALMSRWYPAVAVEAWGTSAMADDPEAIRLRGPKGQIMWARFLYPPGAAPGDTTKILLVEALPLSLRVALFGPSSLTKAVQLNTKGVVWGVYLHPVTLEMIATIVAVHAFHLSADKQFTVNLDKSTDRTPSTQSTTPPTSESKDELEYLKIWKAVHSFLLGLGDSPQRRQIVEYWTNITFREFSDRRIDAPQTPSTSLAPDPNADFLAQFLAQTSTTASPPPPQADPVTTSSLGASTPSAGRVVPVPRVDPSRPVTPASDIEDIPSAEAVTLANTLGALALADSSSPELDITTTTTPQPSAPKGASKSKPQPKPRARKMGKQALLEGNPDLAAAEADAVVVDGRERRTRSATKNPAGAGRGRRGAQGRG